MEASTTYRGVYGFRIDGLGGEDDHLLRADPAWPSLTILRDGPGSHPRERAPAPGTVDLDPDGAAIWLSDGDRIELDRAARSVRFATANRFTDRVVLHPYLSLPASVHSHWLGRQALHGGAFRHAGRTWAVLGDKEAGKSSTLARLLLRGHEIVSDDVLILDGADVFSGPRCVDLRSESAAALGGEDIGVVGSRGRWRLRAADVPAVTRLEGIVHLEWGSTLDTEPLDPGERLAGLIRHCVVRPEPGTALALLDLASLPTWRLVRPRDLSGLDRSIDALLSAIR
jgi:hypothetical protein